MYVRSTSVCNDYKGWGEVEIGTKNHRNYIYIRIYINLYIQIINYVDVTSRVSQGINLISVSSRYRVEI